jgi:hypothetical protein
MTENDHPIYIYPEDGNRNVCRNAGQLPIFDANYTRKPKFYTSQNVGMICAIGLTVPTGSVSKNHVNIKLAPVSMSMAFIFSITELRVFYAVKSKAKR